uniref:Polymerase nucleotidyl transferase domain-containing protein n=2 Tax=Acidianus brierleyi TaxID=41673 RepID=A0A2U9IGP5_9CREN
MSNNSIIYMDIAELCGRVKSIGYFGSYTREDYIEGVSDINVFAITEDKSLLIELASNDFSPVVLSENDLQKICSEGEPLCYYIIFDSKVVCGSINATFIKTQKTCERLKKQIVSFLQMSIEGFFRGDQISSLSNAYKSFRSLIQWKYCLTHDMIPLSNKDLDNACKELNMQCATFDDIVNLRKVRMPITLWSLNKIYKEINSQIHIPFPSPIKINELTKGKLSKILLNDKVYLITNEGDRIEV